MYSFLQDVRYAVRLMLKSPGFSMVAILTLALGIGANTTMFSVINSVLLESAPFRDPQRLVMVWETKLNGNAANKTNVVNPGNYVRWTEQNQAFEDMGTFISWPFNVRVNGEAERVQAGIASPSLFSTLGTHAILGRTFLPEEQQRGKDNVVMISYAYWQNRFGGDPAVIGKDMVFDATPVKIVGVLPPDFNLFDKVAVWTPFTIVPQTRDSHGRSMTVIARLKPGVTLQQAQADMDVVAARIRAERAPYDAGWGVNLVPFNEQMVGGLKRSLYVLFGAVGFVLLIACANVANLLMAKASAREKEIAIRAALGISRSRLVAQLLTESTLLALLGGAAGIAVAYGALSAVIKLAPAAFPGWVDIRVDLPVLGFTFAVCVGTGILFGLVPALRAVRTDPQEALKEGGRGSTAPGRQHVRNVLVVVEAATALILLVGAGILMRSFVRLMNVNTGFRTEGILTMEISLSGDSYRKPEAVAQYFQEAVARVQQVHGVKSAAAISWLPLVGMGSATGFTLDDRPAPGPGEEPVADVRMITPDYFRTMGIPVLRGRTFDPTEDRADAELKKVVVSKATVEAYWPDEDPIGKTIHMPWDKNLHAQVIGVVDDIRTMKLEAVSHKPMLYWYSAQVPNDFMTLVARTDGDPTGVVNDVKMQLHALDPTIPVANIRTMRDVVGSAVREPRFTAVLLGIFAVLALLLAAIGLYGVLSYSVSQRQHELGIRMALGARPGEMAAMVLREGMALTLLGALIGFVASLALVRLLSTLVFGISTHDVVTFATVPLLIAVVAAVACYLPARRATRVDPMIALRYE